MLQAIGRLKPGVTLDAADARPDRGRRRTGARVSEDEQGARRHARTAARRRDRQRSSPHLDAVPRRRRLRAADVLRQRRQSAPRTRHGADARAGDPVGAWRRTATRHPPAADREPRAVDDRRRAGRGGRRGDRERRAGGDPARAASRRGDARRSTCASIAFCAGAALLVGLLFGLAPAWQATELSSSQVVASDSRTVTGRGGRFRSLLVVGEVATAVLLLFGAGLLLRTLLAVENVDRGYRARQRADDDGRPARLDAIRPTRLCCSSSRRSSTKSRRSRASAAWPGRARCRWGRRTAASGPSKLRRDRPMDERQRPIADYEIVSPHVLPDAGSARRRGPRLHRSGQGRQRSRLHGERSVRPPPSRRAVADRPACRAPVRAASARRAAGGERDRRRRRVR